MPDPAKPKADSRRKPPRAGNPSLSKLFDIHMMCWAPGGSEGGRVCEMLEPLVGCRSRDAGRPALPGQNRTCATHAYGGGKTLHAAVRRHAGEAAFIQPC